MVFVDSLLLDLPTACSAFYLAVQKLACLLTCLVAALLPSWLACLLSVLFACIQNGCNPGWEESSPGSGWLVGCLPVCLPVCLLNSYGYSLDWGIRSQQAM